ncbi:MAG: chemotaxis protein CheA [Gemmatimonadaceae bacterium]
MSRIPYTATRLKALVRLRRVTTLSYARHGPNLMDDLLRDFLTESAENLTKLDSDIVELERRPGELSLLNSIFRTVHTIKGTCGFLGLARLETVAHAAESVLVLMRDGKLAATEEVISAVLGAVDVIKMILDTLERTEQEPEGDDLHVIARLDACLDANIKPPEDRPAPPVRAGTPLANRPIEEIFEVLTPTPAMVDAGLSAAPQAPALEAAAPAPAPVATPAPNAQPAAAAPAPAAPTAPAAPSAPAGKGPEGEGAAEVKGGLADSTLRVNVMLLDNLMNLVGELVLARNQLVQISSGREDSAYATPVQHLNRVATDLQEAVMKTRMQPIGSAWTKLPRLVRDLSTANGKKIELELHGAETELDRQILQAIQDPLTHMIRNSADHGIESPDVRRANGKSEKGTLRLNAFHEGGHVILEVADDGAGINVDRVRRKAVERGLLKSEAAAALPDAQVLRLIFEPGFSTAEKITNVSGRGVGMDVVRSNIEKIGGTVDLTSREGQGTTVRIKIPLTLAIINALLVEAAGELFAIPQIGVVELVRVTEEQRHLLEDVNGARFFRLRDILLPIVHLASVLQLGEPKATTEYNLVVCQVGETRFGLVVDEVFDTQEIVVKPVGRLVKNIGVYAGCTILGDGRVIMILDTTGIATTARMTSAQETASAAQSVVDADVKADDRTTLLLFDAAYPALQAVPLALVARLEEIPQSQIEEADGRFLVQYRDALLPIVPANPSLDVRARDPRPVVVFRDGERTVGLAVDEIRDIVDAAVRLHPTANRPGVQGVAVIGGRATEVVDTRHFLANALDAGESALVLVGGTL